VPGRYRFLSKPASVLMFLTPLVTILLLAACGTARESFPVLSGPWLGQTPPGAEPELFAPGIVSTGMFVRDIAMTPEGDEIYWCVIGANYTWTAIMGSRLEQGRWTEPRALPFSVRPGVYVIEPHISADGRHFYFVSNDPAGQGQDIYVCDRQEREWGEPYRLAPPVNSANDEFFPSLTRDGTWYFTRRLVGEVENAIWRSRLVDGQYEEPVRLPGQVNCGTNRFNAFIDPDERYLIVGVAGMQDSYGGTDYYVVFRSDDDRWSEPVNMGEKINTASPMDYAPYVSPDGRYFFFMTDRRDDDAVTACAGAPLSRLLELHASPRNGFPDIWWVEAAFIEDLRPEF